MDCTYTNTLQVGALQILKNSTKGGPVSNAGAVFSYDGSSVTDNGAGDEDPTIGEVCVSGLLPGDYDVTETSAPPGYGLPVDPGPVTATVAVGTNCSDNPPTGAAVVTFTDPPLADIQVNFRDGGSGETSVTSIVCDQHRDDRGHHAGNRLGRLGDPRGHPDRPVAAHRRSARS